MDPSNIKRETQFQFLIIIAYPASLKPEEENKSIFALMDPQSTYPFNSNSNSFIHSFIPLIFRMAQTSAYLVFFFFFFPLFMYLISNIYFKFLFLSYLIASLSDTETALSITVCSFSLILRHSLRLEAFILLLISNIQQQQQDSTRTSHESFSLSFYHFKSISWQGFQRPFVYLTRPVLRCRGRYEATDE